MAHAGSRTLFHPLYSAFETTWRQALDVFEGTGGFLDETRPYLLPHPREWLDHSVAEKDDDNNIIRWVPNPSPTNPSPKLKIRRKMARYENIAAALLETVTGALFLDPASRTFKDGTTNDKLQAWWQDVDGRGTAIDAFMRESWVVSAVFGHAILLLDKDGKEAPTQADVALPVLSRYTPLDMIDWLLDEDGSLIGVKLLEAVPRETFDVKPLSVNDYRVRVVDRETWTLYDHRGKKIAGDAHGFGKLPIEILYGRRRPLTPVVGKSVMGDPQLYIDAYNLVSEVRELLRNQTFALLNVPIGQDGDPSREQARIGSQSGTSSVLFSTNPIAYVSPQPENVQQYHEHIDRLTRTIYRLASVPWEGDSKDAESADSRKIKRQDLHNVLSKYAAECQRTERCLVDLVYRALVGPDRADAEREADGVTVTYPSSFEPPDLEAVAARAGELIGLDLGETAVKEIKKRTVRVALPNLDKDKQEASDAEIDAIDVLTAEEKQANMLEQTKARFGASARMPA